MRSYHLRLAQTERLADARRATHNQPQQPVRRVTLAELVGGANLPWCSPALVSLNDSTSSKSDSSDFDGPDLFTLEFIYAKKTSIEGNTYCFVGWLGLPRPTLYPAVDLPQAPISRFEEEELGTGWPVDYRGFIPRGDYRKPRKRSTW
ncbi:hypothetical protein GQ600_1425 [Phytophthora cactorum]|nr:hypothetical protein GQ600_1425 [Phytophthora cactorum]